MRWEAWVWPDPAEHNLGEELICRPVTIIVNHRAFEVVMYQKSRNSAQIKGPENRCKFMSH